VNEASNKQAYDTAMYTDVQQSPYRHQQQQQQQHNDTHRDIHPHIHTGICMLVPLNRIQLQVARRLHFRKGCGHVPARFWSGGQLVYYLLPQITANCLIQIAKDSESIVI